jgi:hypothetical protein
MKPTDYRDMTWEEVKEHLVEDRLRVYHGLQMWGPCTTRQLAGLIGMDLLTVRPRMTELCQMDFAEERDVPAKRRILDRAAREGYYGAVGFDEAEKRRRYGAGVQCEMQLGGV